MVLFVFQFPIIVKEYGTVSHVDFCRSKPHDFIATCSSRVSMILLRNYEAITEFLRHFVVFSVGKL